MPIYKFLLIVTFVAMIFSCSKSGETATSSSTPSSVTPATNPVSASKRDSDIIQTSHGELRSTPLHHASLLLEIAGSALYVDPVKDANLNGLPKADAIFITHDHPDHLDPSAIEQIYDPGKTVIFAPLTVAQKLPKNFSRVSILKPGEMTGSKEAVVPSLGFWFAVEAVAAYNLQRGPAPGKLFHPKGVGLGYVLVFGDKRIYISGDTECTPEMRALRDIEVAFVCMNLPYTMTPTEAAECIKAFRPKIVYPYHFRDSNLNELERVLEGEKGIEVRIRKWYAK